METVQDLFISHANADKTQYVLPLTQALKARKVTFWLDSSEIKWGDNFVMKINEELRESRFGVLCLSKNFLGRGWTENELTSILAIHNSTGTKRILPLILNAKEEIFERYPLLTAISYRDFNSGPDMLADELAQLVKKKPKKTKGIIKVIVESVHTGQLCNLDVPSNVSVKWLATKAQAGMGLKDAADVGAFISFGIRWVLVDVQIESEWKGLPRAEKQKIRAMVASKEGTKISYTDEDSLGSVGVYNGIVFHLYAIEDVFDGDLAAR
jgi:hypothetical protein